MLPDAARRAEPEHWAELLRRERVTVWNSVPALLRLLHADRAGDLDVGRGTCGCCCCPGTGSRSTSPAALRRELPAARLVSLGGATEGAIWSVLHDVDEVDPDWDSVPYGRAMRGQQACVLDTDWGPRPVWVPGPLYLGRGRAGPGVLAGAGADRGQLRRSPRSPGSGSTAPATWPGGCRTARWSSSAGRTTS